MAMKLWSPAFVEGGVIPGRFAREGDDVPPPLRWTGVPVGTAELALELTDPDAPGGTFVHWIVAGLEPGLDQYDGDRPPPRVEGRNGWGETRYGGPCPPTDDPPHRYVFTLYAMAEPTGFAEGGGHVEFMGALRGKELTETKLVGRFSR